MAKTVLFAAALLLLGALAGNEFARYAATRHQPARAAMLLAQFHFDRLKLAAQSGRCPAYAQERDRLSAIYSEIVGAFPKAYASDEQFRKRADDLRDAARSDPATTTQCSPVAVKRIDDACEACHRDYR